MNFSSFEPKTLTVLVVDDERNLRLLLCRAMETEGYQVQEASSGESCLALCEQHLPDLILLDAVMPDLDGFACCNQLQARLADRCPPILMITALSDCESVDRAFAAGAIDFVTKPIQWPVLRRRVQRILQTHQAMTELRQLRAQVKALQEAASPQTPETYIT
ncbi:response regulator [Leptolyngbya sp. 'hensonii']|uniref:response regulator n=1 Tax=Leptolyngbya sp. 'hensonii' TaxID=1922337 RepID=UPI00094F51F3|nr:response regulator [Leptolyngbya sp. 'hensonii']OLP16458.1 response regulator [Leptolyngbya sp. 'hensonii']